MERDHECEFGAVDCITRRGRNRVVQSCFVEKTVGAQRGKDHKTIQWQLESGLGPQLPLRQSFHEFLFIQILGALC